jgi:hypothetical protein
MRLIILTVIIVNCVDTSFSQDKRGIFRDSVDNAFDISRWLLDLHGFIPLLSPITEPAVGYGLAGAGVYFIPKKKANSPGFKMPDIVGLGGGFTQNGTWFAGGGYIGFWKDNHIRYRGILGYGNIRLKYYGLGEGPLSTDPASFRLESLFFLQQLQFRIHTSNFFLGGNYLFNKTKIHFFEESDVPDIDPRDSDLVNSGITLIGEYESFNNILSPTRGIRIQFSYRKYLEFLGSDQNSQRLGFFTLAYIPVFDRWVAGIRLESFLASDNTPFFLLPYINLRGVPALRYQGELTALAETEQYFNVYKRWGMVAFAGYGRTVNDLGSSGNGSKAWNAGGGFRYLIARHLGLQMGIDVGWGPENWAFYIIFGSSWLK